MSTTQSLSSSSSSSKGLLLLSEADVVSVFTPRLALAASADAFLMLARSRAQDPAAVVDPACVMPERTVLSFRTTPTAPTTSAAASAVQCHTLFKPCLTEEVVGLKVVSVRPENVSLGLPSIPASVLLMHRTTGLPKALVEATELTAMRTAAGSALSALLLLPSHGTDARVLTVFGSGLQAFYHVVMLLHVCPSLRTIHIVSRSEDRARALVEKLLGGGAQEGDQVEFKTHGTPPDEGKHSGGGGVEIDELVRRSDIVACCTASREPLFHGSVASAGTHFCLIGSYTPEMREVDVECVRKSKVVVDDSSEVYTSCGEFIACAATDPPVAVNDCGELGQVLQRAMDATATATGEEGKLTTTAEEWLTRLMDTTSSSSSNGKGNGVCTWPRESKDCVTLFKSAGTAVQDLVIADRLVVAFQAKTV